jgi:hypothetical protein
VASFIFTIPTLQSLSPPRCSDFAYQIMVRVRLNGMGALGEPI